MRSLVALALLFGACTDEDPGVWAWKLPAGFPEPRVPEDNPMSADKVELGRRLFYDTRLSGNGTQSCASCHEQSRAFTDGRTTGLGSTGEIGRHNSMSLANVAYNATQTWANDVIVELEQQALVPMFGDHPVELGLAGHEGELLDRLRAEPIYPDLYARAFPDEEPAITVANTAKAIAAFERTIVSGGSRFDRKQLTTEEQRGYEVFNSERLQCHHCHGGFNFTISYESMATEPGGFPQFANTALYNIDGAGGYPADDTGLFELDPSKPKRMGRFKPVTLRNVGVTAPYTHDGSVATLEDMVDIYARGGRLVTDGPNAGDGALNPNKSLFLSGFPLSAEDKTALVAFLRALTDEDLIGNPALANPW